MTIPSFPRGGKQLNMTAPTACLSRMPGMKASTIVGVSSSNRLLKASGARQRPSFFRSNSMLCEWDRAQNA